MSYNHSFLYTNTKNNFFLFLFSILSPLFPSIPSRITKRNCFICNIKILEEKKKDMLNVGYQNS
jgi:hypothetical protein